jgi:excisionase family DNA binding protein
MAEPEMTAPVVAVELLTAQETADRLRVDPQTLKRWLIDRPNMRKRLGAFKTPGGHWRFDAESVERYKRGGGEVAHDIAS